MDESSEVNQNPFDVDEVMGIIDVSNVSPGHKEHMDDPKYVEMEVKNKLSSVISWLEVWKMKKAPGDVRRELAVRGVREVAKVYPEYDLKIRELVGKNFAIKEYKDDIFPPEKDE